MKSAPVHVLVVSAILTAFPTSILQAADPAPFSDAVAVWHMGDLKDSAGKNSRLSSNSDVRIGVPLHGDDREASLARGGDGHVAEIGDGYLSAGQGADGELNLTGEAMTILLRLRNPTGRWGCPLFAKYGGHEKLVYNIFSANLGGRMVLGCEIGTERVAGMIQVTARLDHIGETGWHDAIARYDGKSVQWFVDGILQNEVPAAGSLREDNLEPCLIGAQSHGGRATTGFRGLIDHAALWNRALSDAEIATLSGGPVAIQQRRRAQAAAREQIQQQARAKLEAARRRAAEDPYYPRFHVAAPVEQGRVIPHHVHPELRQLAGEVVHRRAVLGGIAGRAVHRPEADLLAAAQDEFLALAPHEAVLPGDLLVQAAQVQQGLWAEVVHRRLVGERAFLCPGGPRARPGLSPGHERPRRQQEAVEARRGVLALFGQQPQLEIVRSLGQLDLAQRDPVDAQGDVARADPPRALVEPPSEGAVLPELPRPEVVRPVRRHLHAVHGERLVLAAPAGVGQPRPAAEHVPLGLERRRREPRPLRKVRPRRALALPPDVVRAILLGGGDARSDERHAPDKAPECPWRCHMSSLHGSPAPPPEGSVDCMPCGIPEGGIREFIP
ncbi:hypothetical protein LCGC14_1640210 [marine sediment metagenome]|uniref:LamG-like jellyroll fold domain-containing protein n=1 Tax=marine sediment metagenome TaxID=412755 RepID=A0A0F9KFP9_9ZZZZ